MKVQWKQVIASLLLGLLLGIVAAFGALPLLHGHRDHHYTRMVERFSRRLDLTPEQKTQVSAILEAKRQKMDVLRAEVNPKFEEIRNSTKKEIRKILTAEQQKKFDALEARRAARREKWHKRLEK